MEDRVYTGEVIWFSAKKGFGFISWEIDGVKQQDLFLHYTDISMEGYKAVKKDQKVSFSIGENKRAQPKAINVSLA